MNKTAFIFAAVLAAVSCSFAQLDFIDETITGADAVPGEDAVELTGPAASGPFTISNSTLTGGSTLTVTNLNDILGPKAANGGYGFRLGRSTNPNKEIFVSGTNTVLQGGQGGTVEITGALAGDVTAQGGVGLSGLRGELTSSDASFYGGDGGTVTVSANGKIINTDGGDAIRISRGFVSLNNIYAEGGQGGSNTTLSVASPASSANGGSGVSLFQSATTNLIVDSSLVGGDGGYFLNIGGGATANGGAGLSAFDISGSLVISNSTLTGGNGGTAIVPDGSIATVNGGVGLYLTNASNVTITDSILSGGTNTANLELGDSLEIQSSSVDILGGELNGDLVFSGTGTSTISIVGTTFEGRVRQTGGAVNVNDWEDEYFEVTLISDGTMSFIGKDFNLTNFTLVSTNAAANFSNNLNIIPDGVLTVGTGTVTVVSNLLADTGAILTTDDGSINVGGDATLNSAASLTLTNGSLIVGSNLLANTGTTLTLSGTNGLIDVGEDMILNSGSSLTVGDGSVIVGSNLVTAANTTLTVDDGSVTVGGDATLLSGSSLTLGGGSFDAAELTFNSGSILDIGAGSVGSDMNITFNTGSTLNIETGSVTGGGDATISSGVNLNIGTGSIDAGGDLLIDSGNTINAVFDGNIVGTFTAANNLTISSNVTWKIDTGDVLVTNNTPFELASAGGNLTNQVTVDDVELMGERIILGWLANIQDIDDTGGVLKAIYIQNEINEALGVADDTFTEYGQAMADLTKLVPAGSPSYVAFANLTDSKEETEVLMVDTYLRTTEMANSLVGLQSILSDQIKNRTRSYRRHQAVGYPDSYSPNGAWGWDAMRDFSDRLEARTLDAISGFTDRGGESGINTDGMRDFSNRMEDNYGAEQVKNIVDAMTPEVNMDVMGAIDAAAPDMKIESVSLPPTYKTWGRGYGSSIDQNKSDGVAGYETTVAGVMLGIDRQINNVLIGLVGGYANTQVEGDTEKDGESDTGHVSLYFSAHGDRLFLDANANYAFNSVETDYDPLDYEGDYDAHTVGLYLGGGYVITIAERFLLIPEASILSTYYTREDYKETSIVYPDLDWDSYDEWSHLSTLGATLSMIQKIDFMDAEMTVQPEVRVHWLHEFNEDFDGEEYKMVGGDYTITTALMSRDEDLLKVGAGVRLSKWDSDNTEVGIDVDGTYGDDYEAYMVSGKILHRF